MMGCDVIFAGVLTLNLGFDQGTSLTLMPQETC